MDNPQIDLLSILIAAVVSFIIGGFWYSKWLFGSLWKKLSGIQKCERISMLWNFIATLLTAYLLGFFEIYLGVTTVSDGIFVGFLAWLGFSATTQISGVIWCKQPFRLFMLDGGYRLLSYLVMGGIIGA